MDDRGISLDKAEVFLTSDGGFQFGSDSSGQSGQQEPAERYKAPTWLPPIEAQTDTPVQAARADDSRISISA